MEEKRGEEQNSREEDALSLCDLPHTHHQSREEDEKDNKAPEEDDFDFCSLSKEAEMCAADEVFHQGQILPLHSTTSINVFPQHDDNREFFLLSVSSSEDHFSSASRSSSTGSSAAASDHKSPPQKNQFHSHPSPSPKSRFPTNKQQQRTIRFNARKKSSAWNILPLGMGLVSVSPPPEIAFRDLKNRYPIPSNSAKRNSRSHTNSRGKKRVKGRDFFGGCRCCSTDAVDAVRSRVVVTKTKRSASNAESEVLRVEEEEEEEDNLLGQKSPKKRTFEWLKQLSLS